MVMKHMSKLIPDSAPYWLKEANGNAVFCKVSDGSIFDMFVWILPIYSHGAPHPFCGHDGNWYRSATPVTDEQTLIETENLR